MFNVNKKMILFKICFLKVLSTCIINNKATIAYLYKC